MKAFRAKNTGKPTRLPSGIVVPWPADAVWLHQACPKREEHDPMPRDFQPISGLSRTHRQAKHDVCGLWSKWVPR